MQNKALPKYLKAIILDMDGVLWRGNQPVGDLPALFKDLNKSGVAIAFATNNSSKDISQYLDKFLDFGIAVHPWQIISSSLATAAFLKEKFPQGGNVYIVGELGLFSTLAELGFTHAEKNVIAVIAGIDREFSYEKLSKASNFIRNGAIFLGTNPDSTFPTPDGLSPGAGSILAAIQTASHTAPIIAGKPFPTIINMALKRLGVKAEACMVVGDRLDTDILAGQQAGCLTAYLLSGVGTLKDLDKFTPPPDYIFNDLTELVQRLKDN